MIVWLALDSDDVEKLACPFFSVTDPIAMAPSLNVTVPVAADGFTCAVKVMGCPFEALVWDDVKVTLVDGLKTVIIKLLLADA
jgi:hypothetical protein